MHDPGPPYSTMQIISYESSSVDLQNKLNSTRQINKDSEAYTDEWVEETLNSARECVCVCL